MTAHAADGSATAPSLARLPRVLLAVAIGLVALMVPLSLGKEEFSDTVFYGLQALILATTGAFVASRHPANPIGWIFLAQGTWGAGAETWEAFAYHSLPTAVAGQWVIGWTWVADVAAYVVVFLLFPTGRLLTRRWRVVGGLIAVGCALAIPGQALSADNPDNPLPVDSGVVQVMFGVGMVLLLASMLSAITSIVLRYRRASGVERLQLRALMLAASIILPTWLISVPFYYESIAVQTVTALAFLALPIAVGLAILRHRLYELDVVINRTLVYGALTATLAASYLASVLLLQLAVSPFTEGSGLAVALSTLAVAALFRPLRARIQAIVDRRFFRRRYDAARTLASFSSHLRDEVDVDALGDELRAVATTTMQPAHVSLWLRAPAGGR
ncbi:MAG TPA: hypothetical protein VGV90_11900 [Solirubrobacteraceae bacterium]|nr:hypothetical protein [Solirubrobacteraceae bacterium]